MAELAAHSKSAASKATLVIKLLVPAGSLTQNNGNRTMVSALLGAEAPQDHAGIGWVVNGPVPLGVVATATLANRLAATVVIGNQVITVVDRIAAGTHPRNR